MHVHVRSNTEIIIKQHDLRAQAERVMELVEAFSATSCKTTSIQMKYQVVFFFRETVIELCNSYFNGAIFGKKIKFY